MKWCQRAGLNCRPKAYESSALPLSYSGERTTVSSITNDHCQATCCKLYNSKKRKHQQQTHAIIIHDGLRTKAIYQFWNINDAISDLAIKRCNLIKNHRHHITTTIVMAMPCISSSESMMHSVVSVIQNHMERQELQRSMSS